MNNKITGIITVRTSSSRLPNKCLLKFGSKKIIEHIIDRCLLYGIDPILCTSTDTGDDILEEIALSKEIKYYRGSLKNKIKRWSDCSNQFNIDQFHTIDADDPFFDGEQIKESMAYLNETNSDIITPTTTSANGAASVGYSIRSKIIQQLASQMQADLDTEYIWNFLDKVEKLKKLTLPENINDKIKMRLTLDYEEDYLLLNVVRAILGNDANRLEINKLFKDNPQLYLINWFRNQDYLDNQKSEN